MTNFVAFEFCDNDFHEPLRKAITYVIDNRSEELTIENFELFVLRGMSAFHALRRIDNFFASQPLTELSDYFKANLKVSEVNRLDELRDGFEGYIYDKNIHSVYYHGY